MSSLDIINSFKEQISYADECETVDLTHIYKDFYVLRHEDYWFIPIQYGRMALLVDCPMFVRLLRVHLEVEKCIDSQPYVCVIWGGTIEASDIEFVVDTFAGTGVTPFWTCPKTHLNFAQWLSRVSDGIDWARTFERFNPDSPQIVMEWDK